MLTISYDVRIMTSYVHFMNNYFLFDYVSYLLWHYDLLDELMFNILYAIIMTFMNTYLMCYYVTFMCYRDLM